MTHFIARILSLAFWPFIVMRLAYAMAKDAVSDPTVTVLYSEDSVTRVIVRRSSGRAVYYSRAGGMPWRGPYRFFAESCEPPDYLLPLLEEAVALERQISPTKKDMA